MREGLEACVFVGGVALTAPGTSVPLSVFSGIITGSIIGYFVYFFGGKFDLSMFYIFMTWYRYIRIRI